MDTSIDSGVGHPQKDGILYDHVTSITDLPMTVMGHILSKLAEPREIASVACTCHYFDSCVIFAPLKINLRSTKNQLRLAHPTENHIDSRYALTCIMKKWKGTCQLDISGSDVTDDDVRTSLEHLIHLEKIILDGCQKLTFSESMEGDLTSISLQRCFRVNPSASRNLLYAAHSSSSRLRCLLLSHLDIRSSSQEPFFPEASSSRQKGVQVQVAPVESESVAMPKNSTSRGLLRTHLSLNTALKPGLRILALHNCSILGACELLTVAATCPLLEMLLLGGSGEGLGLVRPDSAPRATVTAAASALAATVAQLPLLWLLEITFFGSQVVACVRSQVHEELQVWDLCDARATLAAARLAEIFPSRESKGMAHYLNATRVSLDRPRAIPPKETSLDPLGAGRQRRWGAFNRMKVEMDRPGNEVPQQLQAEGAGGKGGTEESELFIAMVASMQGSQKVIHVETPKVTAWISENPDDVLAALRAAANCSNLRKRTPLHEAALRGDPHMVAALLSIGAMPFGSRDTGGASALFLAAECGFSIVCQVLLRGGADVLACNRSGETPLYIAALKGHVSTVDAILAHCSSHRINWQDPSVYGDGWTPLMAAAVANRKEVGQLLLTTALSSAVTCGSSCSSIRSSTQATQQVQMGSAETASMLDPFAGLKAKETHNRPPSMDRYSEDEMAGEDRHQVDELERQTTHQQSVSNPLAGVLCGEDSLWSSHAASTLCLCRCTYRGSSARALLDAQNRYGQTALHIAARRPSLWFVLSLLRAGASPRVKDAYGRTAGDEALKQGHHEVRDLLRNFEAAEMARLEGLQRASHNRPGPTNGHPRDSEVFGTGGTAKKAGNLPSLDPVLENSTILSCSAQKELIGSSPRNTVESRRPGASAESSILSLDPSHRPPPMSTLSPFAAPFVPDTQSASLHK